jgi:DNA-binding response OmpR family regulator
MNRILLLEDDESLGATLQERLVKEGYQVDWVKNLVDAKKIVSAEDFDVAILDVSLPDGSGFDFAKFARQRSRMPFLFLTAMATAEHRLQGYELGAEEFIPKPFHLKELLLRVGHVLENHAKRREVRIGKRTVNFQSMAVEAKGEASIPLSAKDCEVLRFLYESSPDVVHRDRILEKVWGEENFPTNRTVDNSIMRIRQALADVDAKILRTVRSVGYQLILKESEKIDDE